MAAPIGLSPLNLLLCQADIRTAAGIPLPRGGGSRMQLLPMESSPDGLISAPVCGYHEDPRLGGAHHNQQHEWDPPPRGGVPGGIAGARHVVTHPLERAPSEVHFA